MDDIWLRVGRVEVAKTRGYVWRDAYARLTPAGGVEYPWLTKQAARADSRKRGAKAQFFDGPNGNMKEDT